MTTFDPIRSDYDRELERRARERAEQQFQAAFSAICRTFNLCDESDQYRYSPEARQEVERVLLRLMDLTRTAPMLINRAAFAGQDQQFRQFVAAVKRRPRKAAAVRTASAATGVQS